MSSPSAMDHNSVLRPLFEDQQQHRIRLDIIPSEGCQVRPNTVEAAIRPDTRLMVIIHSDTVLGSVQNIRAVANLLHDTESALLWSEHRPQAMSPLLSGTTWSMPLSSPAIKDASASREQEDVTSGIRTRLYRSGSVGPGRISSPSFTEKLPPYT
jgi:hypothetical protein